jgi:hypothetical protein
MLARPHSSQPLAQYPTPPRRPVPGYPGMPLREFGKLSTYPFPDLRRGPGGGVRRQRSGCNPRHVALSSAASLRYPAPATSHGSSPLPHRDRTSSPHECSQPSHGQSTAAQNSRPRRRHPSLRGDTRFRGRGNLWVSVPGTPWVPAEDGCPPGRIPPHTARFAPRPTNREPVGAIPSAGRTAAPGHPAVGLGDPAEGLGVPLGAR